MIAARHILEAETSTLVIHQDDRSTDFLKPIYDGMGYPVITDRISPDELARHIKAASRCFMLGHGSPGGLFMKGGYQIDHRFGKLLAEKQDGLYIWCNADAYAVQHKLTGFSTGMFISEVGEAAMFGIRATQQEVDASNNNFSRIVREIADGGRPTSEISACYGSTSATCKITKFNSERMYIFNQGTPTPALHPTSYGIPRDYSGWGKETDQGQDQPQLDQAHSLDDLDWSEWSAQVYDLAMDAQIPLGLLTDEENEEVMRAYLDGATPEEVVAQLQAKQESKRPAAS